MKKQDKKAKVIFNLTIILIIIGLVGFSGCVKAREHIEVHIGYQSVTAQTWGALIIKNQNMLEQKLSQYFPDAEITVVWHDDVSGAVINNNMFAGKYQIGYMGDMPCLINGYNSINSNSYNSKCIAVDGRGVQGINQDILIPINSDIKSIMDLEGKTISTPIGSSAHRMLLRVLQKYDLVDKVTIVHQDINVANTLLAMEKVDAFSVWAPYGEYLVQNNVAKVLLNGKESEEDYLTGIVINEDWAKENPKIYDAFLECIEMSHDFINKSPEKAARIFEKESGFPYNVCLEMVKSIKWDKTIYSEDIQTFKNGLVFLNELEIIREYECDVFFAVD